MTPPTRHRRYRRELDPNNSIETMLRRCCGAKRFVFNEYIAASKRRFQEGVDKDRFLKVNDFKRDLTARKTAGDLPWLNEVPGSLIEAAADDADRAYQNFYASLKKVKTKGKPGAASKRVGLPRFKKRGRSRDSFRLRERQVKFTDRRHVEMTKIGVVRLKEPFVLAKDSLDDLGLDRDEMAAVMEKRIEKVREMIGDWFEYGEYINVEIDLDAKPPMARLLTTDESNKP